MKKLLTMALLIMHYDLCSIEKLPEKYCVNFGESQSQNRIVEYYSFACPHCINLYRNDFDKVQKSFLNEKKANFTFHPVPLDLVTIQAMICLEKLNDSEKRLFLDAILREADEDSSITVQLMQKAMEVLKKPIPDLQEKTFLSNHPAFQDAFNFIKQDDSINVIPSIELNGQFYSEEVPEYSFIKSKIKD